MGSPISAMALKALLILAAIGLVFSENSHCSANNANRDCTCGDKAFFDCIEPVTDDQIHTADFEECKFQCDLFASFGACDWFLFVNSGPDENCHLFGPGKESMADYLSSCNLQGQPTRRADDTCIMDPNSAAGGVICDPAAGKCPQGCSACDNADKCSGYVETGCSMTDPGTQQVITLPVFEGCQAQAISNGDTVDNIITLFQGYDSGSAQEKTNKIRLGSPQLGGQC